MAKGYVRSNREIRKPKKTAAEKRTGPPKGSVSATFAKPAKFESKAKKK